MPKAYDVTGKKFGRLTALKFVGHSEAKKRLWLCSCDCGKEIVVAAGDLYSGNTKSCGCYHMECITKHGGWQKGSYNTWRGMMRRCYNQKDKDFCKYGALGVTVQESWHDYAVFAADVGEPEGAQTLHRIDPYGNYTKENCKWATLTRQAREVRVSRKSKTGHQGVVIRNGKFSAQITVKKKKYYAPLRSTLEEALADRKALEEKYWDNDA